MFQGSYRYTGDLLKIEAFRPDWPPLSSGVYQSPINVPVLHTYLQSHLDQAYVTFIIREVSQGFRVGFDHQRRLIAQRSNHPSSLANSKVVSEYVTKEVTLGRMVGPVLPGGVHTSTLGLIPKAHQANKRRLIVDFSCPSGNSVKDGIAVELSSIQYTSVDRAVDIIRCLGRGAELVKIDLKDAYRLLPVHTQDQHLLGVAWEGGV